MVRFKWVGSLPHFASVKRCDIMNETEHTRRRVNKYGPGDKENQGKTGRQKAEKKEKNTKTRNFGRKADTLGSVFI